MGVKKRQTPARSTQYLLSVDRTLRRISLKKIPVRVKKAANRVQSRSAKRNVARETKRSAASPTNGWPSSRAIVYALIGIVAAAATLIGAPSLVQRSDSTIAAGQPTTSAARMTAPSAPLPDTAKAAVNPVVMAGAATRNHNPEVSASNRPVGSSRTLAVKSAPHADVTAHAELTSPPAESKPNAEPKPHGASMTGADVQGAGTITISGCLQGGDDSFWLKDTAGGNAPRTRSWKSGFLKKQSASIQLVDVTDALKLSNYVGQRVTATGTLSNRTMQARSLHRIGGSCN